MIFTVPTTSHSEGLTPNPCRMRSIKPPSRLKMRAVVLKIDRGMPLATLSRGGEFKWA